MIRFLDFLYRWIISTLKLRRLAERYAKARLRESK
jgi:hypothetical protein